MNHIITNQSKLTQNSSYHAGSWRPRQMFPLIVDGTNSRYLYLYSIFSLQLASTHSFHSNGLGGIEDWKWHTGHLVSLSPTFSRSRCHEDDDERSKMSLWGQLDLVVVWHGNTGKKWRHLDLQLTKHLEEGKVSFSSLNRKYLQYLCEDSLYCKAKYYIQMIGCTLQCIVLSIMATWNPSDTVRWEYFLKTLHSILFFI